MDQVGGYGYGYGDGCGDGYGDGCGDGFGSGYGDIAITKQVFSRIDLPIGLILQESNSELKRMMIESQGADKFFRKAGAVVIHRDIDLQGNPRQLVRFTLPETEAGYIQAVRVICPTTNREYFLGVPSAVKTCQEAVAATFGLEGELYRPDRES